MIRTSSILFWFCLAIAASIAFYQTTDNVQALEQKLRALNASIESEQQNIHVLNAEWVYLTSPQRVEAESRRFLTALRPTAPQQVARMNEMAELLPTRAEVMTSVAVNATPIGNVHSSLVAPTPRHVTARKTKGVMNVASADTGHINDRMIIQHAASPPASPDAIGSLINELGTHP
jgi:hypothetical protein